MAQRLSCWERYSYKVTELGLKLSLRLPGALAPHWASTASLGPGHRRGRRAQSGTRVLQEPLGCGGAVCFPNPCFAAW